MGAGPTAQGAKGARETGAAEPEPARTTEDHSAGTWQCLQQLLSPHRKGHGNQRPPAVTWRPFHELGHRFPSSTPVSYSGRRPHTSVPVGPTTSPDRSTASGTNPVWSLLRPQSPSSRLCPPSKSTGTRSSLHHHFLTRGPLTHTWAGTSSPSAQLPFWTGSRAGLGQVHPLHPRVTTDMTASSQPRQAAICDAGIGVVCCPGRSGSSSRLPGQGCALGQPAASVPSRHSPSPLSGWDAPHVLSCKDCSVGLPPREDRMYLESHFPKLRLLNQASLSCV